MLNFVWYKSWNLKRTLLQMLCTFEHSICILVAVVGISEPSKVAPRDDQYGDLETDQDGDRVGLGDFRPVPPPGGSVAYTP